MTKPRWYCITSDGAATLCVDRADAEQNAADADIQFPCRAPHRAVQLVEAAPQPQQAAPVAVPDGWQQTITDAKRWLESTAFVPEFCKRYRRETKQEHADRISSAIQHNEDVRELLTRLDGLLLAASPQAAPAPAVQGEPVAEVLAEVARATRKFPTWPTDPLHAVAVLGEEFGELTKAVLQTVYEPHKVKAGELRTEAIQTAAMALRFLASLDSYRFERCEQHEQPASHPSPQAQAAPAPPQQAPAPQQALTQAQRIRLWNNSPEYHGDVVGRDAFERLVKLVESVHRIGTPAPQLVALTNADVVEAWRTTEAARSDYGWTSCEWFQAGVRFAQRFYGITQPSQQEWTR